MRTLFEEMYPELYDAPAPEKDRSDLYLSLKSGVQQIPGAVTGLMDVPLAGITGERVADFAADRLGELTGFTPAQWAKNTAAQHTQKYRDAQAEVNDAWNNGNGQFGDVASAIARNPSLLLNMAAESAPSMLAGGGVARKLMGLGARGVAASEAGPVLPGYLERQFGDRAGAVAGGAGEGMITAGQNMDQTDRSADPQRAALAALAAGGITGGIGYGAGRLANRMGLGDVDELLIGNHAGANPAGGMARRPFYQRIPTGMFTEGVMEELPQSMQEQAWQNYAEGKPIGDNVLRSGVEGMLTGGLMGGAANVRRAQMAQQLASGAPTDLLSGVAEGDTQDMFGGRGTMPAQMTPGYNDLDPNYAQEPARNNKRQMGFNFDAPSLPDTFYGNQNAPYQERLGELREKNLFGSTRNTPTSAGLFSQLPITTELDHTPRPVDDPVRMQAPVPQDVGSAISVLRMAQRADEAGQAIPAGSPFHQAILQATNILQRAGVNYASSQQLRPDVQVGQGQGSQVVQPGAPGASTAQGQEAQAVRSAGAENYQGQAAQAVASAKPGTKAALQQQVNALFPEGSPEHVEHTNAIDTAKTFLQARTALATTSPDGMKLALSTAPDEEKAVVRTALGWDEDGNQVSPVVPSYADIGKAIGVTKQRVQQILKKYGINKQVIDKLAAAAQESVDIGELMPGQQEDGGTAATGFRVVNTPSQLSSALPEDAQTKHHTAQANAWAIANGANLAEAPQEAHPEVMTAAEAAIEDKRQAGAAAERARAKAELEAAAAQRELPLMDHNGNLIGPADIADATEDYNEGIMDGDATFAQLPREAQRQYIRAYVAYHDKNINAQTLMRIFGDIADANRPNQNESRGATEEGRALGEVQTGFQSEDASASPGNASDAGREAAPETSASGSEVDERRPADPRGEVTAQSIEGYWNKNAKALGVANWDGLTDSQRDYLLGSGTWSEVDDAAQDTVGELNGEEGHDYAEGAQGKGTTVDNLRFELRRAFFAPARMDALVKFHNTLADAGAAVPALYSQAQFPSRVKAFVDRKTGIVHMVAENIREGEELSVLLHEIGVHAGMEKLVGKANMEWLASRVEEWAARSDTSIETRVAQLAVKAAETSSSKNKREELIAYMVEGLVKNGVKPQANGMTEGHKWFRRLWAAAKQALRKLGFKSDAFSAQHLVDLAYGAAQLELSSEQKTAGVQALQFAESPALDVMNEIAGVGKQVAGNAMDKFLPTMLTLHQLDDQYGKDIPAIAAYTQATDRMEQFQQQLVQKAHPILLAWQGLKADVRDRLHKVMLDATLMGIHPDRAFDAEGNEHLTSEDRAKYAELKSRYNALGKDAKAVYQQARDYLADTWEQRGTVFDDLVKKSYDSLIEKHPEKREELEATRDKLIRDHEQKLKSVKGPYFPLLRIGDYLTIAKSKAYADLEAKVDSGEASSAERAQLDAMKKDAKHYAVHASENLTAAETLVKEYLAKGMEAHTQLAQDRAKALMPLTAGGMKSLSEEFASQFDRETAARLEALLTEAYVAALPENASLARQLNRVGVHGAETNMLRVFAKSSEADAFHLSRMKFNPEIENHLRDVNQQAKEADKKRPGVKYGHVARNINARVALDFQRSETPIQSMLARMSSFWHLGVSPAYLMTNATQPWMMTLPQLGGKYGFAKTARVMGKAWVDAKDAIVQSKKGGAFADINLDSIKNKDERRALQWIKDLGQIDITQNFDAGNIADGVNPKLLKLQKTLAWANHHIEASNRITTALAAYRLAREAKQSHEAAQQSAYKAVVDTQLDYSNGNAAYWMKAGAVPMGKLIFQFRKYQQGMFYLLARNAQLAFKGDKEAAKSLAYLMAMQGVFAGAVGIPFLTLPIAIAAGLGAGGGDDEDGDLETQIRNYLADAIGPDVARAMWKGLPTLLGMDVSKRIGLGDLWNPVPFLKLGGEKTGQEGMGKVMVAAGGAPFGTLANFWDAEKMWEQGDWQKAVEKAAPKMFSDVVKAYRYGTEGMTSRTGKPVMGAEQFSISDLAQRALGFSPSMESEHYDAQAAKMDTQERIKERRERLISNYANAKVTGNDLEALQQAVDNWNAKHPEKGVRIDRSALVKATTSRKKEFASTDPAGVKFGKNEKHLAGVDRFAY